MQQSGRDSDNPNFIQPTWQEVIPKSEPCSILKPGWTNQVFSKTPVEQTKNVTWATNLERIHAGATHYAFKQAYPELNIEPLWLEKPVLVSEDGTRQVPAYHLFQMALNPWVHTNDDQPHPQILMRSTHPINQLDEEMLNEIMDP